ncbi:probable methyltransferase TARBP1 isoform X1 [Salarias fasciatus]|uniref:probable methyltransferase TARBP1 isoform X1 n=1 Tax=Salarias fasciatus TaxID=181472 RepID=UPI00117668C9|nr:probable methyltransferase TARBP1 isoform X1 [Salarias fasciatus]
MNSVLLNAVLSGSPDHGALFEALSWPEESSPQTEQLEALTAFIEALGPLLDDSGSSTVPSAERRCIREKIESVIWKKCLPLLSQISAAAGDGQVCRESTAAGCRLLAVCVRLCGQDASRRVALSVLPSLHPAEEGVPSPGRLGVEVAGEVLAALLPLLSLDEQFTASTVSSALSCIRRLPDAQVSRVISRVLVPLLSSCSGVGSAGVLGLILDDLCCWHSSTRTAVVTERTLLCLTALSDHLLNPHGLSASSTASCAPDPRLSAQFWRMIQDGLTHRDNLSRKRALYLLKRCAALSEQEGSLCPPAPSQQDETLFKWSPTQSKVLREFWEDYVLVMETLEENQVHVVRPVLNRIDTLVQTTVNDSQGQGLFHPSWLLCVYQRMFHSENKSLMKEGVCHLLELQVLKQPAFASAFSQFIVGPFMDVLSETSLFHRSVGQNVGDCPELGVKLQVFMTTFFSSLPPEQRSCVLLQLIQQLGSKHWCAVPLLFVSQALSKLPTSPLLGSSGLTALREVLRCTMITHQVLLRGATQCFLLNSAFSLTIVGTVTLDDVFNFLMHFRADESLCRGTKLWDQVCAWLLENESSFHPLTTDGDCISASANEETVAAYAEKEIQSYLRVPASTGQAERLPDSREAYKLARVILLCVDMERRRQGAEISNTLESLLSPLLDTLSKLSTHIYLPLQKSDRSLQLVLSLLQLGAAPSCRRVGEEQGNSVMVVLEKAISKLVNPIQAFIFRRLSGELQELQLFDIERAQLYLSVLTQLAVTFGSTTQQRNEALNSGFSKLIKSSLRLLREPGPQVPSVVSQVTKSVAMASLATVCYLMEQKLINMQPESLSDLKSLNHYFYSPESSMSQNETSLGNINKRLLKPSITDCTCNDLEEQGLLLQEWGRIAASFMRDQWLCLNFLTKAVGVPEPIHAAEASETLKAVLSCGIEALSLLPSDLVLPVLACMETVLPQLVQDAEPLCVEAVTQSWELVQGLSTNAHDFWPALKGFISMAFQQKLLQLTHTQASTLLVTLKQIGAELMELSQSKSGVFGVLLQHCCQTWLPADRGSGPQDDAVFASVFSHMNIVTEACIYGPVFRRDQRLVQDVHLYVEQLGEACAANVAIPSDNRDDQLPRTCVMAFLNRLDPSNAQHETLMEEIVMDLLKKDNSISRSKVRYYSNSLQHRVKNRIWQTLLQLLPKLRKDFVATLLSGVYEAGFCANQASVKYLIEWMMILILVRYPQHIDSLWACFSMDHDKTKTSVCTFLSVLVHFSVILPSIRDKAVQLHKALDVILQSCFNHNFSVRLYALLALKRVWSLAEDQAGEEADALKGLSSVIKSCLNQAESMQSTGNANKNWMRIQEHFFFGAFHPIRDYSVETIFFTFPSLSELADDEWIPTWKFEKLPYFLESPSFPLQNPVSDLNQLQPGDWIQQDKSEQDKEERWAEVQKKITPWGLGIHEQELELQLVPPQRAARLGKLHGALLVVASLIDKPTNLGGLCRTCEIFGASALVLDSLRHVTDKHFQALSVSSELWLPLLEVKPTELTDFLQTKKSEGYCIVGVEQTANSHSLQDYQFPEKTLLLLGNEREGIPANLLQMLDVCVEIPQQGVIRSLNVHVSAALLIWEYTRQHLGSGPAEVNSKCS